MFFNWKGFAYFWSVIIDDFQSCEVAAEFIRPPDIFGSSFKTIITFFKNSGFHKIIVIANDNYVLIIQELYWGFAR